MTDNITLPRDVGERLYDLLLDRIDGVYHASSEDIALRDALDAALAEQKPQVEGYNTNRDQPTVTIKEVKP